MKKKLVTALLGVLCVGPFLVMPALAAPADAQQAPVNLNTASVQELMALPGIGQTVAERIVAYREANGPFEKKEELMNVRGIGEKTFLKLEPMIQVEAQSRKK